MTFTFENPDPRFRAGSTVRLVIDGREIPDALQVPRQAVFEKNGKTFVYLRRSAIGSNGATSRSPTAPRAAPRSQASNDGDVIALIDPDVAAQRTRSSSSGPLPAASGPAK